MKEIHVIKLGKMHLVDYDNITHDTRLVINLKDAKFFHNKEKANHIADRIGGIVITFQEVKNQ